MIQLVEITFDDFCVDNRQIKISSNNSSYHYYRLLNNDGDYVASVSTDYSIETYLESSENESMILSIGDTVIGLYKNSFISTILRLREQVNSIKENNNYWFVFSDRQCYKILKDGFIISEILYFSDVIISVTPKYDRFSVKCFDDIVYLIE